MSEQHGTSVGNGPANDSSAPSQRASGGSGGEQLTHNISDTNTDQRGGAAAGNRQSDHASQSIEPAGSTSAATAANRTAQDTRSEQAGSTGTGLGAAQTGGNQDEFDMPKE